MSTTFEMNIVLNIKWIPLQIKIFTVVFKTHLITTDTWFIK